MDNSIIFRFLRAENYNSEISKDKASFRDKIHVYKLQKVAEFRLLFSSCHSSFFSNS